MSPNAFMLKVIGSYQDARVPQYVDEKISRGRSHAVSSVTEDLFAYYLIANDASIEAVYVDQPITLSHLKKQIYPDIVIVKNGMIIAFMDLKMDIGWNRSGLYDLCEKHLRTVNTAKGTVCLLNDGSTKEKRSYEISDNLTYSVIIISSANISPKNLEAQVSLSRVLEPSVEVVILCKKGRPNTYGINPEVLIDTIQIDNGAFDRVLEKITL